MRIQNELTEKVINRLLYFKQYFLILSKNNDNYAIYLT